MRFVATGTVTGGTYIGEFEAETAEQAEQVAWYQAGISLCHHCSLSISDPEVTEIYVEPVGEPGEEG